ncbi:MAG: hypothetical protein WA231_22655 [Methylocella sp.]
MLSFPRMSDHKTGGSHDIYSDEETARRRDDVIRRMANTPPKPHSEMKLGKRKPKVGKSSNPKKKTPPAVEL